MAEQLIRQFDLLTMRFAMELSGDDPVIGVQLEGRNDGAMERLYEWSIEASEIGIPERLDRAATTYRGCTFTIPSRVLDDLRYVIAESNYQGRPLWLHLAKPIGYLNLVPWEELLQSALEMPILRVPDFLANPPRESVQKLEVALCGSVPMAKAEFTAADHLYNMAQHLLETVPRRTTVHVFCDASIFLEVRHRVKSSGLHDVHVHDPDGATSIMSSEERYGLTTRSTRVRNPWLLWMLEALNGRSVDMVHFLAHGYTSRDAGALAFAESPIENEDRRSARFVGASELLAFLTQVGAWCAAFSSPEQNYSEMGLRLLADTIAQMRPGPVLHHEMRLDEDRAALAGAYRFLFDRDSHAPPSSPALFTYCHPSFLNPAEAPGRIKRSVFPGADDGPQFEKYDIIDNVYDQAESIPAWMSSSQRYLEQRRKDVEQMSRLDRTPREKSRRVHIDNAAVIEETLQQIEKTLGEVMLSKGIGDK